VRASTRRSLITIEQPVRIKQANASVKTTWQVFKTCYVGIETIKSFERQALSAVWPGADSHITMRYIEGLSNTMRINFNGVIYSILGINNIDMRNRTLVLTCQSGIKAE